MFFAVSGRKLAARLRVLALQNFQGGAAQAEPGQRPVQPASRQAQVGGAEVEPRGQRVRHHDARSAPRASPPAPRRASPPGPPRRRRAYCNAFQASAR